MRLLHSVTLLGALAVPEVPYVLHEPDYVVAKEGERWAVRKPGPGAWSGFLISQHQDRNAAESERKALPRLRLSGLFVRFDPVTYTRTAIADWAGEEDAREADAAVRGILNRFAPAGPRALLETTPLYMARLFGATGHTAEESGDHTRFVIYLDPFRATGRLHAAATLLHELTHVERYRARGFHVNRAAALLPKRDFVLLGLADEFAAYVAEANMVRSFLNDPANAAALHAAGKMMVKPELRWPLALTVMLGFGEPAEPARRTSEARRQVVLDLARVAASYWDSRHKDFLNPRLRQTVRDWHQSSREWKEIAAEQEAWREAESETRRTNP